MPEDSSPPTPLSSSSSPSKQSSSSFVYPVRSLLTAIQPAASLPRSRSTDHVSSFSVRRTDSQELRLSLLKQKPPSTDVTGDAHSAPLDLAEGRNKLGKASVFTFPDQSSSHLVQIAENPPQSPRSRRRTLSTSWLPSQPIHQSDSLSSHHIPPTSHQNLSDLPTYLECDKGIPSGKMSSPNFRHFPAEEGEPNFPRTFSTVFPLEVASPAGVTTEPGRSSEEEYSPIPLPLVASPALAATSVSLLPLVASPPLSAASETFLSSPENQCSSEKSEEQKYPVRVRDFVHRTADERESSPGDERRQISESSFSIDIDPLADPHGIIASEDVLASEVADEVPNLPFNPSQYGFVHLPPLPSPGTSEWWSGSAGSSKQASLYTRSGQGSGSASSSRPRSVAGVSDSSKYYSVSPEPAATDKSEKISLSSKGAFSASERSDSGSEHVASDTPHFIDKGPEVDSTRVLRADARLNAEYSSASEEHTTFRFKHAADEHGNYVVVGREGKLQRCEDEPIKTPGAVQGFGVLIAVEDTEDTLNVRQVSENSTELLGLSPRFLFSLECFTDTLTENSAGTLWDNIQFLIDPISPISDEEDNSPHIFVISGWGEPGSAPLLPDTEEGKSFATCHFETRRYWTCWCAVHRVQTNDDSKQGLIIMEFELESDQFNPLYPLVPSFSLVPPHKISQGSPNSTLVSSPGTSTPGSGSTAVSEDDHSAMRVPSSTGQAFSDTSTPAGHPPSMTPHPSTWSQYTPHSLAGLKGQDNWMPSAEDVLESTTNFAKPLPALERLRRLTQRGSSPYGRSGLISTSSNSSSGPSDAPSTPPTYTDSSGNTRKRRRRKTASSGAVGMMDVFAVMAQINEQLGAASDLDAFLKVTAGVIKDLTQFHRVLVYQFDEAWNGQVVSELVDWGVTRDLYRGLHFPAADIPKQARELYMINKVRVLYDRAQPTARIVVKDKADLGQPLNMTHCYLRAMSPIHIKYLENMGVRASMSVSIMAFDQLWGLVACHSYGNAGMRVSFPVRQMLRLLSQSISRNIERLSYAQRLHTRKLINTLASDRHPTGYIVSNADDLLGLFDADFGILVIGEGAKILGPNQHGQEILIMAEYLRLKQFDTIQASQAVINDFPDLHLTTGFEVIAGLLYVPLSSGGKDFIAFLRRGQLRDVHWAGKPFKSDFHGGQASLEPRKSFKIWSETVAGRCRAWTDEQLETAGVLALVYGKFIEVWRQKQTALQTTKLTNILLSNATHEVRTPLNHIINYLEMAMNGPLDGETRDNLVRSHAASKSLLFTINDLLDLTRLESGNETSFNEPFDLHMTIEDAVYIYQREASRRSIDFILDISESPRNVVGDSRKIRTVVQNLTANALKYTEAGSISVSCKTFGEPEGLRSPKQAAVEIIVADSGCGIQEEKLEKIFREFEQVESSEPRSSAEAGVGLGLAVVARIVEQLGGQLRVESRAGSGSRFSFLIPLALTLEGLDPSPSSKSSGGSSAQSKACSRPASLHSARTREIEGLVEALSSNHMSTRNSLPDESLLPTVEADALPPRAPSRGTFEVKDSRIPIRPVKVDYYDQEVVRTNYPSLNSASHLRASTVETSPEHGSSLSRPRFPRLESRGPKTDKLRILIVEDNDINRAILAKRLTTIGHTVVNATNGQEGVDKVKGDGVFDAVLMDIQMPIVNGFEATQRIRVLEQDGTSNAMHSTDRLSHKLNGRIPIFAVSASLTEQQREELISYGLDGWILKPIDFKRLNLILKGVTDSEQRKRDVYRLGGNWEVGGWFDIRKDNTEAPLND